MATSSDKKIEIKRWFSLVKSQFPIRNIPYMSLRFLIQHQLTTRLQIHPILFYIFHVQVVKRYKQSRIGTFN